MTSELPSSRNVAALPAPAELWKRCVALAVLDRILCSDWEGRYYSFDAEWSAGEHVASMRNGSGDDYFIGFSAAGVFVKGFAHESPMSPYRTDPPALWPGMYEACPESLAGFRDDPAFSTTDATFCLVWDAASPGWRSGVTEFADGADPDGSEALLGILGEGPERYARFARGYYELEEAPLMIARIAYQHDPIDMGLVVDLAEDVEDAVEALSEILMMPYGAPYPFGG